MSSKSLVSALMNHGNPLSKLLDKTKSKSKTTENLHDEVKKVVESLIEELKQLNDNEFTTEECFVKVLKITMESLEELSKRDDLKHASVYESLVKMVGEFRSTLSSPTLMYAMNDENKNDTDNTNTNTDTDTNNQLQDNSIKLEDSYPNLDNSQKSLLDLFAMLPRGSGLRKNDMLLWWFGPGPLEIHLDPILKYDNNKESGFEKDLSDLLNKKLIEPIMAGVASNIRKNNIREGVKYKMPDVIWSQFYESNNEFPESIIKKVNSFSVSKNGSVVNTNGSNLTVERLNMISTQYMGMLQLGNWNHDRKKYIVVEDADVLSKILRKLNTSLWFLSLEGVSGLVTLPSLPNDNLRVFNLKGCHNLESLPPEFNSPRHKFLNLEYLDLSDCCQLDHSSDAFNKCINLRVLKGFILPQQPFTIPFISTPSNFEHLWKLTLRTRRLKFPTNSDLETLCEFPSLAHLKIEWIGACSAPDITHDVQFDKNAKFPPKITKFEMEGASKGTSTNILNLISRQNIPLEKLYVKGGDLTKLEDGVDCKILRLQYVPKMELNVYDMASSFPKLHRLEMSKDVIYSMLHQSFKIATATVDSNSHWIPNPFKK